MCTLLGHKHSLLKVAAPFVVSSAITLLLTALLLLDNAKCNVMIDGEWRSTSPQGMMLGDFRHGIPAVQYIFSTNASLLSVCILIKSWGQLQWSKKMHRCVVAFGISVFLDGTINYMLLWMDGTCKQGTFREIIYFVATLFYIFNQAAVAYLALARLCHVAPRRPTTAILMFRILLTFGLLTIFFELIANLTSGLLQLLSMLVMAGFLLMAISLFVTLHFTIIRGYLTAASEANEEIEEMSSEEANDFAVCAGTCFARSHTSFAMVNLAGG